MRHCPFLFASLLLTATIGNAQDGSATLYRSPTFLHVGSGPKEIRLALPESRVLNLTARWNGSARNTTIARDGSYLMNLLDEDVARPGFAEVSLIDTDGTVMGTATVSIGYDVKPEDVVHDRARKRVYLSTPANPGDTRFRGNSVIAFDPETGAIGPAVEVGTRAGSLALSDDGKSLYVVVENDGLVRRIDPETFLIVSEFRFRAQNASGSSIYSRTWIAVMPGNPQTVAVYQHPDIASSLTMLSIYDNGIKRQADIVPGDGFDGLLFSPDGKYLFVGSYRSFNSPTKVLRYSVEPAGIPQQQPANAAGGGPVEIIDGRLYTSHGTIVDFQTMEVTGALGVGGSIAVDTLNQRLLAVYFVPTANNSEYPEYLQAFDLKTQQPLGRHWIKDVNYFAAGSGSVRRLIRFGTDGVVFTSDRGLMVFHTPLAGPAPLTAAPAIVNAASQQAGPIAPGEILTIYGQNLGPAVPQSAVLNALGRYEAALGGVQVWFDRTPGIVLMGYQSQINVIAPFGLEPGSTVNVQVWYFGIPSSRIPLPVASAAPALFTRDSSGRGPVVVINQDGSANAPSPPGSIVSLFGTGGGMTSGAFDGGIAQGARNLTGTVRVAIDGQDVAVWYAGSAPTLPHGAFQINAQVPADRSPGTYSISVFVDGIESPKGATLEIR